MSYRTATAEDIDEVVAVHLQAFPGFFLTRLGAGFLGELYRGFLTHPDGVFLVATNAEGALTGFAAGTVAPERFFADLRRRRGLHFLRQALPALLRSPSLVLAKLYAAIFYRGDTPATLDGGGLLSSIGVSPAVLGQAVGRELLARFEAEMFARTVPFVYLTTDKVGNERVNAFYRRCGYEVESEFMQGGGRSMLRYLKRAQGMGGEQYAMSVEPDERAFLPFAMPDIGEEEIAEVVDALRSGWVTTGPKTRQFEQDFTEFLGGGLESVAVNSATAGLHLALEAIGIGPGDEVIIPTYTFTATAEVIRYLGATPVMVDVQESTFNMDPVAVAAAVTERTKAIMPVHFAGLSCDMDALLAIARQHGLRVVEDAAHALPTTWQGRKIGTLDSDVTVFSFYANKTMTTGEGGMVVTRDPEIAQRCRIMRLHGISRDAFDRYVSSTPAWFYEVVAPGYKYNLSDPAAAIGIHQLRKLPRFQARREQMAAYFNEALKGLPLTLPASAPAGDMHAYHLYPVRIMPEAGISRDDFIIRMSALGVGCSVHFIPLHLQPYWRDSCGLSPASFPVAQRLYEQEVTLPLYTRMTDDDMVRVVAAVRTVLGHA